MITEENLRSVLRYDPETGAMTWVQCQRKSKAWNAQWAGKPAGCVLNIGYVQIQIDGVRYSAHRLAFLYMTGRFPDRWVDHINGIRSDNRWSNLRPATPGENLQNMKVDKRNKSGWRGVSWAKSMNKWQASIQVNRTPKHLGYFETAEDAGEAYLREQSRLHLFSPIPRGA